MESSPLRDISFNELTSDKIADSASKGDVIAKEAFEYTGELLGQKLADSVAHTSPEAIFLFGGLAKAGDLILKPTQQSLEKHLLPIYRNKIKVLISEMGEINAAVLGAGALIWKELEQN
jgi:glucokinase